MFTNTIQVEVATITLWNFLAILINALAFVIIYMKANKNTSLKAFFRVQLAMVIWLLGKVLKTVSPTIGMRWFFIVFYYFGICLLEASFLDFAYVYYKGKYLDKKWRLIIYLVAAVQFVIVATNPYHHLFYSRYEFWGDDFGILFYAHVIVNYLAFFLGTWLCSLEFKKQLGGRKPWERHLISIAILTPLIFNFIYISRLLESLFLYLRIQIFDVTPIIYTWSILLFVYATFKYEFFELSPLMKHEVVEKMDTPLLVTDGDVNLLYTNTAFKEAFEYPRKVLDAMVITNRSEGTLDYDRSVYQYAIDHHVSFGCDRYIIVFMDITAYSLAKKALDSEHRALIEANDKLGNQIELLKQSSLVGARNYIARELHDILGHALVVTIKLLEVSKLFYKTHPERVTDSLDKAVGAIKKGFDEMKEITGKDNGQLYNTATLEKEIKSMLKVVHVSGINVNFYLKGEVRLLDEKVYDTLKRVVTELVTNTLKHAKASKLLLYITVLENRILLQTMDNGQGIKNLVKGNGLNGIDGRLSLVGGKAKYTSEVNEGFSSNIVIEL
ncbi:MAG: hypothetical protein JXO44_04600 [Clostridia bacterium]|nr:hypothetical protein [Clostridia bacterium]